MLKLRKISKTYRRKESVITVIDQLNLEITTGDFVSLIGPSGCGKSTLLLMLGGMLSPTDGEVLIDGVSLYGLSPNERSEFRRNKIGFVFQSFHLIPYLTALENVQVPLLLSGLNSEQQKERSLSLLDRVGLADRASHKPSELSIGQQQRIALARTLANNPSIILADEPTGNLDPEMSQNVMGFLQELNQEGRTIVMVTHDMDCAKKAKQILTLSKNGVS